MNLSQNRPLRLATLCTLYLSQGLAFGFVSISLASHLAARGIDMAEVGALIMMTTLPWTLKPVWGAVIDAVGPTRWGRRRPWLVAAQTGMAASLLTILLLPDLATQITALVVLVGLHNLFVSLQDVATDALAVDLLTPAERGRVNGFMYGSSYLGTSIAGAGLGLLMTRFGLPAAVTVQAVASLLIMLVPLLVRERGSDVRIFGGREEPDPDAPARIPFLESIARFTADLVTAFHEKSAWLAAVFAALLKIPIGIISVVLVVLTIQRLGWTKEEYDIVMSVTNWFGLGGALAGGFLADRFGVRRVAAVTSLATAAVWLAFGLLSSFWTSKTIFKIFLCTHELLVSVLAVACFAMFMGIAAKKVAATQFSTYMAVFNLSQSFGSKAAGWLDEVVPVATVFVILAVFQASITPVLIGIRPRHKNPTPPN